MSNQPEQGKSGNTRRQFMEAGAAAVVGTGAARAAAEAAGEASGPASEAVAPRAETTRAATEEDDEETEPALDGEEPGDDDRV